MMLKRKVFVFDLEDTLYKEIDFVRSAFHVIAHHLCETQRYVHQEEIFDTLWTLFSQGEKDAIGTVIEKYELTDYCKADLMNLYRYHQPDIQLDNETMVILGVLKNQEIPLGIITDGRWQTQMNKVEALGLLNYLDESNVIINTNPECFKPDIGSYRHFMDKYSGCNFIYVADNTAKDFIAPNQLGWTTICLMDDGRNIHPQRFDFPQEYLPQYKIQNISELMNNYCL